MYTDPSPSMMALNTTLEVFGIFALVIGILFALYCAGMYCVAAAIRKFGPAVGLICAFLGAAVLYLPLAYYHIGDNYAAARGFLLIIAAWLTFGIGVVRYNHMVWTGEWPRRWRNP